MPESHRDGRTQILLASIVVLGAVAISLLANWDKVFAGKSGAEKAPGDKIVQPVKAPPSSKLEAANSIRETPRPPAGARFHVIVQSTADQGEAVLAARALRAKGYPSEVIFSTKGLFAVTLGSYDSRTEAAAANEQAKLRRVTPPDAYVLPPERWKKTVFPR